LSIFLLCLIFWDDPGRAKKYNGVFYLLSSKLPQGTQVLSQNSNGSGIRRIDELLILISLDGRLGGAHAARFRILGSRDLFGLLINKVLICASDIPDFLSVGTK